MDAAKKNMDLEVAAVEEQLSDFKKLLKVTPVVRGDIEVALATIDLQMNDYINAEKLYLEQCIINSKDAEYTAAVKKRNEIRKLRLSAGISATALLTPASSTTTTASPGSTSGGGSHIDTYRVKLPKRELQKFEGDVRNWKAFWASFKEIDSDPTIPDIEKYNYLLQAMVPGTRPFQVVSSYPPDGPSYKMAKDELGRSGRDKILTKVYMRDLLKLVIENSKDKKSYDFTGLVTALTAQTRNLEQLGLTKDKFGVVLYPIVESCIPQEVLNRYLQQPGVTEDIDGILKFLNEEVRRHDETELAQGTFGTSCKQEATRFSSSGKGKQTTPTAVTFVNSEGKQETGCGFCGMNHSTTDCRKAAIMTYDERKEIVKNKNLCFRCLSSGHSSKKCKARITCLICRKGHHALMCWQSSSGSKNNDDRQSSKNEKQREDAGASETKKTPVSTNSDGGPKTQLSNYIQRPEVLLQTLNCKIRFNNATRERAIRVMLDTGSQCTYIRKALAEELKLPHLGKEQVVHQTFGAVMSRPVDHQVFNVEVSGIHQPYQKWYEFKASAIENVAKEIISPPQGAWMLECGKEGIRLSDVTGEASDIDLLIGNDIAPYLTVGLRSVLLPSNLVARESLLGWFLEGKIKGSETQRSSKAMVCINMQLSNTDVSKLWSLDVLGITDAAESKSKNELEEAALQHFQNTVARKEDGSYRVHLPFIEGHPTLPDNRSHAVARLHKTTQDLLRDKRLTDYHEIFMSWLEDGIIEVVTPIKKSCRPHYLPHRAVYKENSTTPTRPVFNASAKLKNNVSLNECLETGPNLLERIPSIITGFRTEAVGAVADIKKAFLQIEVVEEHRDCMRLVWWKDIQDRKEITEYRHCRVVFGVSSSPFLLGATLQHLLKENEQDFSSAVKILRNGFYVDNAVTSLKNMDEAHKFQKEAQALLAKGQFDLRGWEFGPVVEEKQVPVLGLTWNTRRDTLQYDMSRLDKKENASLTKRSLLMYANSLFDPLGWLAPFTISVKMLFKKVCVDARKFGWDAPLPEEYVKELEEWKRQLQFVPHVHVPRFVGQGSREKWTLHCFNDASKLGYGTCIYLRINANPIAVTLIQARARVTPEKVLTIPRGELLACLIGARLVEQVKKDLGMPEIPVTFYTDSTTALTWIRRTDAVWGIFVNNRVREIRQLTDIGSWKHVPGNMNPADLPSRGVSIEKLIALKWWEGPGWLYETESSFPSSDPDPDEEIVAMEKKKTVTSALVKRSKPHFINQLVRHGDYHRILRIIAYVRRFVRNKFIDRTPPLKGPIPEVTAEEMKKAEAIVIRHVQRSTWNGRAPTGGFHCEIDNDHVLRIVTRLINAKDWGDFQRPAFLPGDHPIVKLLIFKEHALASHAGVQYMQSILRRKYWITNSRRTIRKIVHRCAICRVHLAKRCQVPEGPLPLNRIRTEKCFQVVGVDLAGPLFLRNQQKVWILIFTCAVYRAVHFEIVASPSTAAFINALRKFVARRGRPTTIYSDNGTNFRGCGNLLAKVNWSVIEKTATIKEIQWIYNPPSAAWWGGFWERLIGMMKQLLRRVLGKRTVDLDELEVLVVEIEAVMNDRPLTYISEDATELRPLTPAMFMRDLPVSVLPDVDIKAKEINRRFRYCLRMKEELKKRFKDEYLGQLVSRAKSSKIDQLSVGDVVLVEVDNKKRLEWPMGVIIQVYSKEGAVSRSAMVRTTHGEFVRPLQRLFPLELHDDKDIGKEGTELSGNKPAGEAAEKCEDEEWEDEQVPDTEEGEPVIVTRFGRKVIKPNKLKISK